jgi:hypothetical protein
MRRAAAPAHRRALFAHEQIEVADDLGQRQHEVDLVQVLVEFPADLHEGLAGAVEVAPDRFLPLFVMADELADPGTGVGDRGPVPRVRQVAVQQEDPAKGVQVLRECGDAVAAFVELDDGIRADLLQEQVAGDEDPVVVVEADVSQGMPGAMQDPQPAAVQIQPVAIVQRPIFRDRVEEGPHAPHPVREGCQERRGQSGGQEVLAEMLDDPAVPRELRPV